MEEILLEARVIEIKLNEREISSVSNWLHPFLCILAWLGLKKWKQRGLVHLEFKNKDASGDFYFIKSTRVVKKFQPGQVVLVKVSI